MRADTTTAAIHARLAQAMAQRAARLDGEAQRLLQARQGDAPAAAAAPAAPTDKPRPLRELVAALQAAASPSRDAYPAIPALADLRQLWSSLRADSRLRQAVAPAPTDAGPLNSSALARRAIALMDELSPHYLRAFLAYVDDLAWLEQLDSASAVAPAAARKRGRRKPQA